METANASSHISWYLKLAWVLNCFWEGRACAGLFRFRRYLRNTRIRKHFHTAKPNRTPYYGARWLTSRLYFLTKPRIHLNTNLASSNFDPGYAVKPLKRDLFPFRVSTRQSLVVLAWELGGHSVRIPQLNRRYTLHASVSGGGAEGNAWCTTRRTSKAWSIQLTCISCSEEKKLSDG